MNALARITLLTRTVNIAPRAIIATSSMGSTRMFGLGSDLASKEKVEEDRYIRQKEHEAYLLRKAKQDAEKATKELSAAEKAAQAEHDAVTGEIFEILGKTGDKVSDECVENLASWKMK